MNNQTKKRIKRHAKNFLLELLEFIKDLGQFVPDPLESKYQYQQRIRRYFSGYPPSKINQGIYELKRRGLISAPRNKQRTVYKLTISGEQKVLLAKIRKDKYKSKDGSSCIVIFDIPEEKAKHRGFLRRFLIQTGFINLQKSVLIGPEFLTADFFELLDQLQLRQNVTVIKGKIMHFL